MKAVATPQKLRGGYYTPKPIADFLANWAIQAANTKILEPSCGDGILLEAAINVLIEHGAEKTAASQLIHGIELDKEMDHSTEKWTMYFLEKEELALLRRLRTDPGLTRAGDVIDLDVGVVTGLNEFFVLTEKQAEEYSIKPYTQPIVGRSFQLQGITYSKADWLTDVKKQVPGFLLSTPMLPFSCLPEELKQYVSLGEEKGMHKGYKCKIRKLWYVVPSVWIPQAFMLRQIHHYPKIILNEASATCTDTIHRIKFRNGTSGKMVAAAFLNSLTFAFSEVIGRSYGGGVLELEPKEAESLPIPLIEADKLDNELLDGLLREGNISSVLDITDDILLRKGLGLSNDEITLLRSIWQKMRDRRVNRKHK